MYFFYSVEENPSSPNRAFAEGKTHQIKRFYYYYYYYYYYWRSCLVLIVHYP